MRIKCPDCKGKKKIPLFTSIADCNRCGGTGTVVKKDKPDWVYAETPTEELEEDICFDIGDFDWSYWF